MKEMEVLIDRIKEYDEDEIKEIIKAYKYAEQFHDGQFRQSGEPYIIHPLSVACILAEMKADKDTICAGLLHDLIEDTAVTKEDIKYEFNINIANLVDGVTKLTKINFSSKQAQNLANARKIITSITSDVRIIIIKLADRLHNMRTLQYKSEFKQKENSLETMEIFVPLAYHVGAYRIKSELENLSFKYLEPDDYERTVETHNKILEDSSSCLNIMLNSIKQGLNNKQINNSIKTRTKNIYGIYKNLNEGKKLEDIHDLFALKIMVDDIDDCYKTLGLVHSIYNPINEEFKDYIWNPKTNMYRSIHTTVFGEEDKIVQTQIRTFGMDDVASFGLTSYWHQNIDNPRQKMQDDLREKYQFFKSLIEIDDAFRDNQEFIYRIKTELFKDKVYVYTTRGDVIELPKGSTAIDFAYKIHTEVGNSMIGAIINDDKASIYDELHNKDRVKIITSEESLGPGRGWLENAKTTHARREIREYNKVLRKRG